MMKASTPAPARPADQGGVPALNTPFSLYLDLVRVSAALLVVYVHSNLRLLITQPLPGDWLGHSAVIVFFVLSGFVIAYVTDTKENNAADFAASRLTRIYSVAIPALLLPPLLDAVGERLYPAVYAAPLTTHSLAIPRIVMSLFLLNESWGLSIQPFSNGPYWSIAYEGWYYILFGLAVFSNGRTRLLLLGAAAVICGPKILLLLPVWLMGVHLYKSRFWRELSPATGLGMFIGSIVLVIGFHAARLDLLASDLITRLVGEDLAVNRMTFANRFLSDYVLGALVFLNFAGFRAASATLGRPLLACARVIREAAVFTFALYLFHRPVMLFGIAVLRGDPARPMFYLAVVAIVLAACVLFGLATERVRKRLRPRIASLLRSTEATTPGGAFKGAVAGV